MPDWLVVIAMVVLVVVAVAVPLLLVGWAIRALVGA